MSPVIVARMAAALPSAGLFWPTLALLWPRPPAVAARAGGVALATALVVTRGRGGLARAR